MFENLGCINEITIKDVLSLQKINQITHCFQLTEDTR
jgi:hypothetical protein